MFATSTLSVGPRCFGGVKPRLPPPPERPGPRPRPLRIPVMPAQPASRTAPAAQSTAPDQDAVLRAGLGAAIRRLRKERGLTLVQLARLAELSHPFLSQLERGLT